MRLLKQSKTSAAISIAVLSITGVSYANNNMTTSKPHDKSDYHWYLSIFGGRNFTPSLHRPFRTQQDMTWKSGGKYNIGGAVGIKKGHWRAEGAFEHSTQRHTETIRENGKAIKKQHFSTHRNALMANGYYDFNTIGKVFTPYVGLGVGVLFSDHFKRDSIAVKAGNTATVQAMAGTNIALGHGFAANVGYRYRTFGPHEHAVQFGLTKHFSA